MSSRPYPQTIINPKTNRRIQVGGKTYNDLIRSGELSSSQPTYRYTPPPAPALYSRRSPVPAATNTFQQGFVPREPYRYYPSTQRPRYQYQPEHKIHHPPLPPIPTQTRRRRVLPPPISAANQNLIGFAALPAYIPSPQRRRPRTPPSHPTIREFPEEEKQEERSSIIEGNIPQKEPWYRSLGKLLGMKSEEQPGYETEEEEEFL